MSLASVTIRSETVVTMRRVVCTAAACGPSAVEHSDRDTIVFPLRGFFVKHLSASTAFVADSATVAFFAAGRPHRISHPLKGGDECMVIDVDPATLREALVENASTDALTTVQPSAILPARSVVARAIIARDSASTDRVEFEETALHLIASALRVARPRPKSRSSVRAATAAKRRDQVHATRALLAAQPGRRWNLANLARSANSSPYELARVFRQATGSSIHQYLLTVRVAEAVDLMLASREDLASIALACGFSNHSHLTSSFRRIAGVSPRHLRSATASALRELRTNLKAARENGV